MNEIFRHKIPADSEKAETRILEARALLDMVKRGASDEFGFKVSDLKGLHDAFKGNPYFEKDREWVRDQLVNQVGNQSSALEKLNILEYLSGDYQELAGQLLEKNVDSIKQTCEYHKSSAENSEASRETRIASAQFAKVFRNTINKIYEPEQREEMEDKFGFEDTLDKTLKDSKYNKVKIRISHLSPPELKDILQTPIEDQWRELTLFLENVEKPTRELTNWSGDSIADRKHFLVEQTNKALAVGVELVRQMSEQDKELAGRRLFELCKTANMLLPELAWSKGWTGSTHREVSVPFERIDNPDIFKSFIKEKAKSERKKSGSKNEEDEDRKKGFEIEIERHLANVGIENDIPELVETQMAHLGTRFEEYESIPNSDPIYEALAKRAEIDEKYQPCLDKFQVSYQCYMNKKLSRAYKDDQLIIQDRLADFLDPAFDWEGSVKVLEEMHQSNNSDSGRGKTEYFPKKLIDKCIQSTVSLPDEQRKERLSFLEKLWARSSENASIFSEILIREGLFEEAAELAGSKNDSTHIAKILRENEQAGIETLWKTKGWDPTNVISTLVSEARKQGTPALSSVLGAADRYLLSFSQVDRDRYVAEDAEKIEKLLTSLIVPAKQYDEKYVSPFNEEETGAIRDRINQYHSFSWQLWQQGQIPSYRETREHVLHMFVEDGRDLSIAELGLGANQKIEIYIASGKVALERKDGQALKRAVDDAKRLKVYEENEDARERVSELEKDQEMLALQTNVAEMDAGRLQALLEKSPYEKEKILNALIESGKYHEAITLCGELGQEKIARQLISHGALEIAEELVSITPSKALPNRKELLTLIAYKKAGGKTILEKNEQIGKLTDELPALLRVQEKNETEILNTVKEHVSDDQRFIINQCLLDMSAEEFSKAVPSYETKALNNFYLDRLFDHGKYEEAVRFAVLHEDGMLPKLVDRMAKSENFKDIGPLIHRVTDIDTAFEIVNTLNEAGKKDMALDLVKRFVGSLKSDSPIFKKIIKESETAWFAKKSDAPPERAKSLTELKRLIFSTRSLESLAHIRSLFSKEENFEKFAEPIFEGLLEPETESRDLAKLLTAMGTDGTQWYSKFVIERGTSKNVGTFIAAIESLMPREEAMKKYSSVYATSIGLSAKEAFVENVQNLSSQEKIQSFIERYNPEDSKDTVLLASVSLDKQEWNKFLQGLPSNEERERAVMLADWYAAPRTEERELGPVIERAASNIAEAIESNDFDSLRLSLDTILSARTTEAASKLTKIFLNHLEQGGSSGTTYQIVNTLSKMESFKANTVLAEIMTAEGTPDVLSRYIIRLLVENGHLDADLRGYFEEKRIADRSDSGEKLRDAVERFRLLMQKYGINPDSSIMRYTDGRSTEEISSSLEGMIEQVKNLEMGGEYEALGEQLLNDLNMRLLYFLRKGGRTKFSLINDYNFAKFTNVLQNGNELNLHTDPLNTFEQTISQCHDAEKTEQIVQRVRSGRFPLTSDTKEAVFDCLVDANAESQTEQARSLVGNTLGRSEFGAFARAIMYRSFIDQLASTENTHVIENLWRSAGKDLGSLNAFLTQCESVFGSNLDNLKVPTVVEKNSSDDLPLQPCINEETLDIGITKFEPSLLALGKKMIDNARKATQQGKLQKEERDRLISEYQEPESVLCTLLANELPVSFAPALDEWKSHVQAAIQASREAKTANRGESQTRQLSLRYLDKTASLPEYLRFADSAMCCFTSKNFQGSGPQQYIARIWKDPLSFVFHIEEPGEEQSDRRNSVGFVFGSYGTNRDSEPVLLLNGVYMDRKTDLAARKVIQTIEEHLAKPLGCKEVLIASQHAGRSNYGADFENTDKEYLRLRAIKQKWNDEPEQTTYDDLALVAVENNEGRAQDSNVVNRWAKTGKHIFRKTVSS
jgi:hypothetical protein